MPHYALELQDIAEICCREWGSRSSKFKFYKLLEAAIACQQKKPK